MFIRDLKLDSTITTQILLIQLSHGIYGLFAACAAFLTAGKKHGFVPLTCKKPEPQNATGGKVELLILRKLKGYILNSCAKNQLWATDHVDKLYFLPEIPPNAT